jgi:hypothetical protein
LVLCLGAAATLVGQRMQDSSFPSPPPSGFSDEDGVVSKIPGSAQRISAVIHDLETIHGFRLYVILRHSLISTKPGDYAAQLQQQWLPEGGGLVIVYEGDTRQMGYGRGLSSEEGVAESNKGLPAYVMLKIVANAIDASKPKLNTDEYIEAFVAELGRNISEHCERKEAPVDNSRSLRLGLVTVGALSLLALCGMAIGWLMGRSDNRRAERLIFPTLDVPERLSAPYGGSGGGYARFTPRGG